MIDLKKLPKLNPEEFNKVIENIKAQRKKKYMQGIIINNKHYPLNIFITGLKDQTIKTLQESRGKGFKDANYFVHVSFKSNEDPVFNTARYSCKSYHSALILAYKMKEDREIEIISTIQDVELNIDDPSTWMHGSTEKYGGYNGFDDQTIDDVFDGDPSLTWNID